MSKELGKPSNLFHHHHHLLDDELPARANEVETLAHRNRLIKKLILGNHKFFQLSDEGITHFEDMERDDMINKVESMQSMTKEYIKHLSYLRSMLQCSIDIDPNVPELKYPENAENESDMTFKFDMVLTRLDLSAKTWENIMKKNQVEYGEFLEDHHENKYVDWTSIIPNKPAAMSKPAIEPVSESTSELMSELTIEPASELAIEPAIEPAVGSAANPIDVSEQYDSDGIDEDWAELESEEDYSDDDSGEMCYSDWEMYAQ